MFVAEVGDVDQSPYAVRRCAGDPAPLDCVHAVGSPGRRATVGADRTDGDVDAVVVDRAQLVVSARVEEGAADRVLRLSGERPAPPLVVVALSDLEASLNIRTGGFPSARLRSRMRDPPGLGHPEMDRPLPSTQRRGPGRQSCSSPISSGQASPHHRSPLVISPHGRGVSGRPERSTLGRAARPWRIRSDLPGRDGTAAPASLLGLPGPDHRPQPDARDCPQNAAVAPDRPASDLRTWRQHGRTGNPPPARATPATATPALSPSTR